MILPGVLRKRVRTLPVILLVAAATLPAAAQSPAPVAATSVWARATPPGAKTGAIYLTLMAPGGDRLTGATSPQAGATELHEMHMDGTIMRMNPVPGGLDLPPGKPVTLQPGGLHLMMTGLKAPLKQGQSVTVQLTFKKSPKLDVTAQILAIGAPGPESPDMSGMKMNK